MNGRQDSGDLLEYVVFELLKRLVLTNLVWFFMAFRLTLLQLITLETKSGALLCSPCCLVVRSEPNQHAWHGNRPHATAGSE